MTEPPERNGQDEMRQWAERLAEGSLEPAEELRALEDALDALAGDERSAMEEARLELQAADRELVAETFRGAAGASARSPFALVRWLPPVAALVLAIFWFWPEDAGNGGIMGDSDLELVAPLGAGDFQVFQWSGTLGSNGWYELRIFDPSAAPGSAPIVSELRIEENEWRPDEQTRTDLPERIDWEIRVMAPGDLLESVQRASASRSDG